MLIRVDVQLMLISQSSEVKPPFEMKTNQSHKVNWNLNNQYVK